MRFFLLSSTKSLQWHYNGNNSYLFVNGRQELKFKVKTNQLVQEKLCIGNLSHHWTTSESEKTGLNGKIYDFVVDYQEIVGTTKILDIHKYLFNIIKTKALECVSVVNQKCTPRPKILDVNEGVGEALFYPYNVLVNKCSGNCNTLDDPMAKLCVPNIIKRGNMEVYNLLMRLNETRNVLWHESCKCICRLNSSVCNSKQIWNSDTCRCDCNEDFVGIISCYKEYTWNPSTCACECDMWCKPGQYLDHKRCVCKNKLIGKVIAECTNIINETIMNNKNNIANDNTTTNIFIGLFSVVMFIGIVCLCVFAYVKFIKGKKLFKNKFKNKYADY